MAFADRMPSVMNHDFSRVPRADIPRSSFDRSHGLKTTLDSGLLVPILVDEVLPGDTFNVNLTGYARMATPIAPIMDNLYFNTFFFFVPYRLIWDNWEKFNGAQDNPGDSVDFRIPQISPPANTGWDIGSIGDYFGLPYGKTGYTTSSLPFRAYNLIWNEWFRDQNLQNSVKVHKGDTPDPASDYTLLRRGKRHDYFTSSLPWPQKGPEVSFPLGTTAPVVPVGTQGTQVRRIGVNADFRTLNVSGAGVVGTNAPEGGSIPLGVNVEIRPGSLAADLSGASAATINQLREAFQIQRLLERDARSGTRYIEILKAHFGVTNPDFRLQRPEYLGGGQAPVNIHQVTQTSASIPDQPQGSLAAFGTAVMQGHGFTKSFTEHGVILGLVSIRADLTYQQGLNRMWSRKSRFDFYWPSLSQLGEQAVLNKEIYLDGTAADEEVFGYQERYSEYRYKPSQITGMFRSTYGESLDLWHLSQHFTSRPHLNAAFIEERPPIDRVIAVQNEPEFIADFYFKMRCARPMPVYGVPGMIDHF